MAIDEPRGNRSADGRRRNAKWREVERGEARDEHEPARQQQILSKNARGAMDEAGEAQG